MLPIPDKNLKAFVTSALEKFSTMDGFSIKCFVMSLMQTTFGPFSQNFCNMFWTDKVTAHNFDSKWPLNTESAQSLLCTMSWRHWLARQHHFLQLKTILWCSLLSLRWLEEMLIYYIHNLIQFQIGVALTNFNNNWPCHHWIGL